MASEQEKLLKAMSTQATKRGEAFVTELYYKIYDDDRKDLLRFYRDSSIVIWNGKKYQGLEALNALFQQIPETKHMYRCIDVQYAPNSIVGTSAQNLLIVVAGDVKYEDEVARKFHQTFILAEESEGKFVVVNDCFRFIGDIETSAVKP